MREHKIYRVTIEAIVAVADYDGKVLPPEDWAHLEMLGSHTDRDGVYHEGLFVGCEVSAVEMASTEIQMPLVL